MKVYRIIVIFVAILLGIFFTTLLFFEGNGIVSINEPVTERDYEVLKENALNVVKTLDTNVLSDEKLTADFYFNQDELVVTVSSMKAEITAKVPISNYSENVEDGTSISSGTAEIEKIEYVKENKLQPVWWYIVISIAGGVFLSAMVYIFFFEFWFSSKKRAINI